MGGSIAAHCLNRRRFLASVVGPGLPTGAPRNRSAGVSAMVFRIQPHVRLHEWVAEERGFFAQEGLDYEFDGGFASGSAPAVSTASDAPLQVRSGAFEDMEAGRSSDVSCACHWAVNAAATAQHGKMYGRAYSVCPSGIYVAADSALQTPADLAGVEVGVGYHSGSHYSALQALEAFLDRTDIAL